MTRYPIIERFLPRFLRRHILDFEARVEDAVASLAEALPAESVVLDAGAGEGRHAASFARHRYVAFDLAVGDPRWNYGKLDCIGDLALLPFQPASFGACLNIVTLEHVRDPGAVLRQLAAVLAPGGRLLLVVPHAWEVHQAPHDYFRYTCYGVRFLLEQAEFTKIQVLPAGGYFRLLARRLWNGLQFFPGIRFLPAALLLAPPALVLPLLDSLDRENNFTLGYICTARKPS